MTPRVDVEFLDNTKPLDALRAVAGEYRFQVLDMDGRRIDRILVRRATFRGVAPE